jgi:hypothetical protein
MASAFRRSGDRLVARLHRHEVEVLRGLVGDVQRLVAADAPANPMTARLFPDPSFDPVAAEELRGLIQDDLREGKRAAAQALLESLPDDGKVALDGETAESWLTSLNDVRLALGTALGVTEESYGDEDDPSLDVYHWLSFLQETLVEALSGGLGDR